MAEWIGVLSGKGGVGKTVSTVLLGAALARLGKKVLLVDGDVGQRNLDIALGMHDHIINHFLDVSNESCTLSQAVVSVPNVADLFFLPAPQACTKEEVSPQQLEQVLTKAEEFFDVILMDCPSGIDAWTMQLASMCDTLLVAVMPNLMSVRDAEHLVSLLHETANCKLFMLITRVNVDSGRKSDMMNATTMVQLVGAPLVGIVPEDEDIPQAVFGGNLPSLKPNSYVATAYSNVARRLLGEKVPVVSDKKKPFQLFPKKKTKATVSDTIL